MKDLPEHIRKDPNQKDVHFRFALPVWHGNVHEMSCRTANSLHLQWGVGCTDGEGIERVWSWLNPMAYSTKEMGAGARHDAIEDRIDYHNFHKNTNIGKC